MVVTDRFRLEYPGHEVTKANIVRCDNGDLAFDRCLCSRAGIADRSHYLSAAGRNKSGASVLLRSDAWPKTGSQYLDTVNQPKSNYYRAKFGTRRKLLFEERFRPGSQLSSRFRFWGRDSPRDFNPYGMGALRRRNSRPALTIGAPP
jgi:hypothetical protein